MNKLVNKFQDVVLWIYWYVMDTLKLIEDTKQLENEAVKKVSVAMERYTLEEQKKNSQL